MYENNTKDIWNYRVTGKLAYYWYAGTIRTIRQPAEAMTVGS